MRRYLTLTILATSLGMKSQNRIDLHTEFHPVHKQVLLLDKKTKHFKFTAYVKPGNKFVENSQISITGLNYEVRAKMYVNKKVSLMMKTKNRTRNSQDVAAFGIIFKL